MFQFTLAARAVARTRSHLAQELGRLLMVAACTSVRRLRSAAWRAAPHSRHPNELALLAFTGDRLLADIGLTRQDVIAAAQQSRGPFGRRDAMRAATHRDEAVGLSSARRTGLAYVDSPPLMPASPMVETSNFR